MLWHYQDDRHFYYLALKPNGWELGKADPAHPGGQRFLVSGTAPTYQVDAWYKVRVVQRDSTMAVWVDDVQLARFTDQQAPYLNGRLGLYTEDAHVQFSDVRVVLPAAGRRPW